MAAHPPSVLSALSRYHSFRKIGPPLIDKTRELDSRSGRILHENLSPRFSLDWSGNARSKVAEQEIAFCRGEVCATSSEVREVVTPSRLCHVDLGGRFLYVFSTVCPHATALCRHWKLGSIVTWRRQIVLRALEDQEGGGIRNPRIGVLIQPPTPARTDRLHPVCRS